MDAASAAPQPSSVLFARGVIARLALWNVLRIATQENWGGPNAAQKQTWIASVIVDSFEEQDPVPDDQYIEEMLLQIMADEFDTLLEDGSAESVARDIVHIWEESQTGRDALVLRFEVLAEKCRGKRIDAQEVFDEDDDNEWDDDNESGGDGGSNPPSQTPRPRAEPQVDEHGFTLVSRKGRDAR
ncbi:hypothetical protein FISHEDRAFT_77741 [Fistulina hepatica ATCC 64428]|nr:hypothetical protein FISHEDRAFT_77741 [Fistulina hepatica ATCC 64428]